MDNRYSRGLRTMAIIAVIIAAALVCTAAGTLAAFSATYTWSSDTTSGDFPFSDTDYTLALFDDATPILPGDSGSAVLEGPSFDGYDVAWTFSETNDAVLPVVFFVRDADLNPIAGSAYSKYDFSALGGTYTDTLGGTYTDIDKAGERLAVKGISTDPTRFVSALSVGATVCWVWPDAFYTDVTGDALSDDAEVAAYLEECKQLCTAYAFDPVLSSALDGYALAFVTDETDGTLTWEGAASGPTFSVVDGLVHVGGTEAALYSSGVFWRTGSDLAAAAKGLPSDAEAWILVLTDEMGNITALAQDAGVGSLIVNAGKYSRSSDGSTAFPSQDGERTLLKVRVSPAEGGHALSVKITATGRLI